MKKKLSILLLIILALISMGYKPNAEEIEAQAAKTEQDALNDKAAIFMNLLK